LNWIKVKIAQLSATLNLTPVVTDGNKLTVTNFENYNIPDRDAF